MKRITVGSLFGLATVVLLIGTLASPALVSNALATPPAKEVAILVHGWQGWNLLNPSGRSCGESPIRADRNLAQQEFADIGAYLVDAGYEVYLASWETRPGYTMRAEEAAAKCLAPQIAAVAGGDRDGKVLLVAHSMGGVVSRAYIEDTQNPPVEALITLGTPHVGVNFASLIKVILLLNPGTRLLVEQLCASDPGLCQLGSDQMLLFNTVYHPTGVPYLFVGGYGGPVYMAFLNFTEGRNDGIVGYRSGVGYLYNPVSDIPFIGRPLRNDTLIVSGGDITRRFTNAAHVSFFETGTKRWFFADPATKSCVEGFVAGIESGTTAYRNTCLSHSRPPSLLAAEQSPVSFTPVVATTLAAGETFTAPIVLDGNAGEILLGWNDGDLALTLIAPDGRAITPANLAQELPGSVYLIDPVNGLITYRLTNPPAGEWTAVVTAGPATTTAEVTLVAAMQSPLQLFLDLPSSVAIGEPFTLTARLVQAATLAEATAVSASLLTPQGVQTVDLVRMAAGEYRGQLIAPAAAGPYVISVSASGATFSRQLEALLTVRTPGLERHGSTATNTPDWDRNGKYERLQIHATYQVAAADQYAVMATLQDADGRAMMITRTTVEWAAGANPLLVEFNGGEIASTGVNGPYRVVTQIVRVSDGALMADEQPLIDGLDYLASDFETGPSSLQVFIPMLQR
ncbi:lipase family alpha/beta hydrolase [Chloroflexus aggregans]|uniref:PGAP1 family protein n=1 Tax=Chloroflexus aggregans (strain MD-66 / DSM 9485) TaxID=326427 RepID=B8G6C8_CHLAD|nr:hypothetical protein [Chloroflexus aggregans]ACL23865.1 hypothetical protein Cagg_0947 [Chloroflexus aggregans DSM 9485]